MRNINQFSAVALMKMTHEESPWKTTEINSVISRDKMAAFSKHKLKRNKWVVSLS